MKVCPVCGCSLKPENYEKHLRRVHKKKIVDKNNEEGEYYTSSNKVRGESKRAKHRKMELQRRKRKAKSILIVSVMLIVVLSMIIYIAMSMNGNENIQKSGPNEINQNSEPEQESPDQSKSEYRISLSEIGNSPEFYSYDVKGVQVRFFAVKDSEGEVHVAFDACDICYYEKKGYRKSGNNMQCINCGNQYLIVSLGTENVAGGCWPSYLPMKIEGEDVVIQYSDLEEKRYMF